MTLPEWVEQAKGLVGGLLTVPIRMGRAARDRAAYIGASFGAAVADIVKSGLAKPLSELAESKLQRIKSEDIAASVAAHNKAATDRQAAEANADLTRAKAERERAEAKKAEAEAKAIAAVPSIERAKLRLEQADRERRAAEANAQRAKARLEAGLTRLNTQGGGLYLPPEEELEGEADDAPEIG